MRDKQMIDMFSAERIPEAAKAEVEALLLSGDLFRYTSGEDSPTARLEAEFAAFMGVPYALAVNSCSSALFLSMKAINLPPGGRVLIPAFTFAAVPSAVIHAGCMPVLVEVGTDYRIDLDDFHCKLDDDISAVLISHMRGHTSDMDTILAACEVRGIPVIEDAAHSLGTTWDGQKIGTLGRVGCFSFQSYKLMNAGEGGMLVSDDADLIARAIIMSGAYEQNWKKHPVVSHHFYHWQNRLPLFNMRMNNLSAAVVRSQIEEVERRVCDGRANHDYVAARLKGSPWFSVPQPLAKEKRAPDSIQFNLEGVESDATARAFQSRVRQYGVELQIFGLSEDNARAFWNWDFIGSQTSLPKTRAMLMRACDMRLPARLDRRTLDHVVDTLLAATVEMLPRAA